MTCVSSENALRLAGKDELISQQMSAGDRVVKAELPIQKSRHQKPGFTLQGSWCGSKVSF